jgi:hypothetical protein
MIAPPCELPSELSAYLYVSVLSYRHSTDPNDSRENKLSPLRNTITDPLTHVHGFCFHRFLYDSIVLIEVQKCRTQVKVSQRTACWYDELALESLSNVFLFDSRVILSACLMEQLAAARPSSRR